MAPAGAHKMNNDKAREFFSSYFEGTLEPGLRQSLDRQFASNHDLRAEYNLFENTLSELSNMKMEEIRIPSDLHEIISARLDRHIYEQKRKTSTGISALWRNLSLGAIGLAAIVGAIYSIPHLGGKISAAGIVGAGEVQKAVVSPNRLEFRAQANSVLVEITPSTDHILSIDSEGKVLQRILAKSGEQSTTPLVNPQANAALMEIIVQGESLHHLVALPGTVANTDRVGQGDLSTFAKAFAGYYRCPVVIDVADTKQTVHWTFLAKEPVKAAIDALVDSHLSIEQRDGKLVTISDR